MIRVRKGDKNELERENVGAINSEDETEVDESFSLVTSAAFSRSSFPLSP
jgi:hypothetical protein